MNDECDTVGAMSVMIVNVMNLNEMILKLETVTLCYFQCVCIDCQPIIHVVGGGGGGVCINCQPIIHVVGGWVGAANLQPS